jgi:hypothetical protein
MEAVTKRLDRAAVVGEIPLDHRFDGVQGRDIHEPKGDSALVRDDGEDMAGGGETSGALHRTRQPNEVVLRSDVGVVGRAHVERAVAIEECSPPAQTTHWRSSASR